MGRAVRVGVGFGTDAFRDPDAEPIEERRGVALVSLAPCLHVAPSTGGRHRSVYLVERLGEYFGARRPAVLTRHRELNQ